MSASVETAATAGGSTATSPQPGSNVYPWLRSYPKHLDWNTSFTPEPLTNFLDRSVQNYPNSPCTYFMGKMLNYKEIGAQVDRAAKGLQQLGVSNGVRVGLMLPNTPYSIIMYYAILKAGGTVVNYNPLYTEEELAYQVKDSGTQIMVTLDVMTIFPKVEALIASGVLERGVVCSLTAALPGLKGTLAKLLKSKEFAKIDASPQRAKLTKYEELIDNDGKYQPAEIKPDDIACLQYTGGTTGTPKGAMLTHANISINAQQSGCWDPEMKEGQERTIAVLPLFHVYGMTGIMNLGVLKASQIVLVPRFDVKMVVELIRKVKPTQMPGVPTLFNAIRNYPGVKQSDFATLRGGVSGGAPLPVELKKNFEAEAGVNLIEGYGLSETSPTASCNPVEGIQKAGSIGIPMPGTIFSLRSLDDPSQEVPLGERGEICIAGPQVMKGYWNKPEETRATFVGEFFRTGDVGIMDEDGFTFIVDRIKDLIICSGFNVYPRRIEEALYEHPAVEEVTVIGIKDDYRGEAPKAFVKLRDGQSASEQDLTTFLEKKLSKIEMPAKIEFRDELPKTMVGKLSKKELREEEEAKA